MSHEMSHESGQVEPGRKSPEMNADRRRFIRAGLVAAPLLITLTARPASASCDDALNGSAGCYASGPTARHGSLFTTA